MPITEKEKKIRNLNEKIGEIIVARMNAERGWVEGEKSLLIKEATSAINRFEKQLRALK